MAGFFTDGFRVIALIADEVLRPFYFGNNLGANSWASAKAATYNCSSVGEHLPTNRLIFEITIDRALMGWGAITGGAYAYRGTQDPQIMGSGKYRCGKANEKGIVFCRTTQPDANIVDIVVHPVMGIMFQITGQEHVVLFNCK